jgi:hypothetical protein
MPADVWIEIQNDECVLAAMKDEIRFVVLGIARHPAKDASLAIRITA